MAYRLPNTLFLVLLLSVLGCTKKDGPAPSVGTGSYNLDSRMITSQATADTLTASGGGTTSVFLNILLTETPSKQNDTQYFHIGFVKSAGQPNTAYRLIMLSTDKINQLGTVYNNNVKVTLSETSKGVYSGTFSGNFSSLNLPSSTVTDGVFTNVRL